MKDMLVTRPSVQIDHVKSGELMRQAREKANLSLRDVAERMGVSAPYLSDLERGRRNWTLVTARHFQTALKPVAK
jgi:transcriptional regulator with XRE-family HTH domain